MAARIGVAWRAAKVLRGAAAGYTRGGRDPGEEMAERHRVLIADDHPLMRKLGVGNRTQAVIAAGRLLIDPPPVNPPLPESREKIRNDAENHPSDRP
jgi:hypothetical protein